MNLKQWRSQSVKLGHSWRRVVGVLATFALIAAATPLDVSAAANQERFPEVSLTSSGATRYAFEDGTVVVGGSNLKVDVQRTFEDASRSGGRGEVAVTEDPVDPMAAAEEYRRLGRSPVKDAIAAGVNPDLLADMVADYGEYDSSSGPISHGKGLAPLSSVAYSVIGGGTIYSSFCVHDNTANVQWDGCVVRAFDPSDADSSYVYYVDQAQASGQETHDLPWVNLEAGGVKNQYSNSNATILSKSPAGSITTSNCTSQGFGVTIAGFGASTTESVCPDKWIVTSSMTTNPRYHKVEWQGNSHLTRAVDALTLWKRPNCCTPGYTLVINWEFG